MTWRDTALCSGMDSDLFLEGDPAALAVCYACPVVEVCLAYALAWEETGQEMKGIWGGTTQEERAGMRRTRIIGDIEVVWEEM